MKTIESLRKDIGELVSQYAALQYVEYRVSGKLTNTNLTMNSTLWLGVYPALGTVQLDFIAEKMEEFFGLGF